MIARTLDLLIAFWAGGGFCCVLASWFGARRKRLQVNPLAYLFAFLAWPLLVATRFRGP